MAHPVNNDQSPQKEYHMIPNPWSCMGEWLPGEGTHGPCACISLSLAGSLSKKFDAGNTSTVWVLTMAPTRGRVLKLECSRTTTISQVSRSILRSNTGPIHMAADPT